MAEPAPSPQPVASINGGARPEVRLELLRRFGSAARHSLQVKWSRWLSLRCWSATTRKVQNVLFQPARSVRAVKAAGFVGPGRWCAYRPGPTPRDACRSQSKEVGHCLLPVVLDRLHDSVLD